jgi:predicted nucleic acid-binding protein
MFLFDTDTLSEILKRTPSPGLLAKLATLSSEDQFTTSITVGEMVYGAHRSTRREYLLQQFEERLWPMVHILPFDRTAAEAFGSIRAELERAGTPLAEPDLRIGAIALTNNLTVVTGNVRHFARIPGLQVENWI